VTPAPAIPEAARTALAVVRRDFAPVQAVIDETMHPWPEVVAAGQPAVLSPILDADGRAVWASSSGWTVPFGDLSRTEFVSRRRRD
jgi:hypothetical protein